MVRNSFAKIYASTIAPDPAMDVLWMDLSEAPLGSLIKFWDGSAYIPISMGNAGNLGNVLASIAANIEQAKSEAIHDSNDYTDMIKDQREMLVSLEERKSSLEEENRLLKNKLALIEKR